MQLGRVGVEAGLAKYPHHDLLQMLGRVGTYFDPGPRPGDVAQGEPKSCFYNAYQLASAHAADGYRYVEGYGFLATTPDEPQIHAWCLDARGNVVDPSWETEDVSGYLGVDLPLGFVTDGCATTYSRGTIDNASQHEDLVSIAAAAGAPGWRPVDWVDLDGRLFPQKPPVDADENPDKAWVWEPLPGRVHLMRGLLTTGLSGRHGCQLVHDIGTNFVQTQLQADTPRGEKKSCFYNAYELARADGLRYVEGYGCDHRSPQRPFVHAWCVDNLGRVFDPTPGWAYETTAALRGVVIPLELVAAACTKLSEGTLDTATRFDLHQIASAAGASDWWPPVPE